LLGAFAAYLSAREAAARARKLWLYVLAGLSFFLAVGSKEIALVPPILILIYELYFFQNFSFAFLRRHPLALGLGLIFLASTLLVYLRAEMWQNIAQGYQKYPFTMGQRLLTEPRVLLDYLGLILMPLPSRLTLEHDLALSTSLFHPWTTGPAILLWVLLLAGALRYARRRPLLSFAALWYLGNLFLESSFLPLDLMFEHRLYLPSLAVIAPLAAGMVLYLPRRRGAATALGLTTLLLLTATLRRNQAWQSELDLGRDAVRKAPAQARAHNNLARAYMQAKKFDQARKEYDKTLSLNPQVPLAYHDRGLIAQEEGRQDQAIQFYQSALQVKRDHVPSLNNLGVLYAQTGRLSEAEKLFQQALQADPADPKTHNNLGNIRLSQGRYAEALAEYEQALSLDPNFEDARRNRSLALQRQRHSALPPP